MEAMIFAAGIGSRLRPFTLTHPKALAPVAGVPSIRRCMEYLRKGAGVSHAVVNIHHFPEQIKDYVDENPMPGLDITFADESRQLLDTGGGLLAAATLFLDPGSPIILHNADIVTDAPIMDMADSFANDDTDVLLLVDTGRSSSRTFWIDKNDHRLAGWSDSRNGGSKPEGFHPDPARHIPVAFNGIHIVDLRRLLPVLKDYARQEGPVFSLTPFYLWAIGKGLSVKGYIPNQPYRWHDIGTPEKLDAASHDFNGE